MKFVADRMMGRLMRWLRLFGYDTLGIGQQKNEDELLLTLAEKEGRILLSRDRLLIRKAEKKDVRAYLVKSSYILEQLMELHMEFNIEFEPQMDRCSLCNSLIRKVEPSDMEMVMGKNYVYQARLESGAQFWLCDSCGQVYWHGKHLENIKEMVNRLRAQNLFQSQPFPDIIYS